MAENIDEAKKGKEKEQIKIPLKKLKKLEILSKERSTSFLQGHRRSIFRGPGTEYSDLREYVEGDDPRFIDWNASSRIPFELIVRDYEQERNTNVVLMLDSSHSMLLGDPTPRIKLAVEASATLAYTVLNNRDLFGWASFSNTVHNYIPPRGGKLHFYHIIHEMLKTAPFGRTNIGEAVREIALSLKRRSIIILLTDLHGDLEGARKGFKVAKVKKHEIKLIHTTDPEEFLFPKNPRQIKYLDPETNDMKVVNFSNLLERGKYNYEAGLRIKEINDFKRSVRGLDIDVITAPTTYLTEKLLLAYFGSKRGYRT